MSIREGAAKTVFGEAGTHPEGAEHAVRPLAGVVVIDLSRVLSGPYAAMMLGDLGAKVIKVERPSVGDDTRSWGPPFVGPDDERESTYFLSANRNKESLAIDLKSPEGLELLRSLLERADVVIENFRPGVLERLGLGHDEMRALNPRLVVLSITGFGHTGPEADRSGYDQIVQGESGIMSLTGPPGQPFRVGVPIADLSAGMFGAFGVVSALFERERTGRGRLVQTSLLAGSVALHTFNATRWLVGGEAPVSVGNHHPTVAPYGAFACADGMVQIAVGSQGLWMRFAAFLDLDPLDDRFADNAARLRNGAELDALITTHFARLKAADLIASLTRAGIPAGEIRSIPDVYASPQAAAAGLVTSVQHPTLGEIKLPAPPLHFDGASGAPHKAPPVLDENQSQIEQWLAESSASS